MEVINFDLSPTNGKRKVEFFPDITRCVIAGSSGSGKSNVLLSILLYKQPIENIYLCSRTAFQEKYVILESLVSAYNLDKKKKKKKGKQIGFFKCTPDTLPTPANTCNNSVLIFDDILTDNQEKIASHFLYSRHSCNSLFYLTQMYTKIPRKSGIRSNLNFLILFPTDHHNLIQIYHEYVSLLIDSFEKFRNI